MRLTWVRRGVVFGALVFGVVACDDTEAGSLTDAGVMADADVQGGAGGGEGGAGGGEGGVGGGEGGVGGGEGGMGGGGAFDEPAIAGDYLDAFGGSHWIDAAAWYQTMGGDLLTFHFEAVDNDGRWAVARNDAANAFSADLYSRFDWVTVDGEGTYYCQTAYEAESAEAAAAVERADDSAPSVAGCGGFPWTRLADGLSIAGRYTDNFATAHWISSGRWVQGEGAEASLFWISSFDEQAMVVIAENDAGNAFSASLFSRFDFVWHEDALYFCQTAYDAESAEAAAAVARSDDSDPANSGCGGMFAWSALTAQ